MYRMLLSLVAFTVLSCNAFCQQVPPVADTPLAEDDKVFQEDAIMASFPGGQEAWRKYLVKNLKPNTPVKKKAPAGTYTVIIRFIVARDGSISDIAAETSHGYGMEEEVIRIIKKGPKWNPGIQNGRTVNAYRRQPVTFLVRGR